MYPVELVRHSHTARKLLEPVASNTHILNSLLALLACHSILGRLNFEHIAVRVRTLAAGKCVHSLLQRVVLPAKEVVAVLAVSSTGVQVSTGLIYANESCWSGLTHHQSCTQTVAFHCHTTCHSYTALYPT
jgi:hypothetical protein